MSKRYRLFVNATLKTASPLHIGNGLGDNTDRDILLDAYDKPYIPGTALAGLSRHYLEECAEPCGDVFGYIDYGKESGMQSDIVFYDASLVNDIYSITFCDNVRIEQDKTAADRARFDYELLETGAEFNFRAELQTDNAETGWDILGKILGGLNNGDIRLGARTTRGMGRVEVYGAKQLTIDLAENIRKYIDFNWTDVDKQFQVPVLAKVLNETITLEFDINNFLFIRTGVTLATDDGNKGKIVDAEQLSDKNGHPVIPGTSWAGVFRHHFMRIMKLAGYAHGEGLVNRVFGCTQGDIIRSKIVFSESVVKAANFHNRTRTAIDRFTGGAGDKKLYTTRPSFFGSGELEISLARDLPADDTRLVKSLLDVCINDINEGFLNIGGEGATGGGILSMRKRGGWQ